MKTFIASFQGVWLGGYGVVTAESAGEARILLGFELARLNLPQSPDGVKIQEIDTTRPNVTIQWNGDY